MALWQESHRWLCWIRINEPLFTSSLDRYPVADNLRDVAVSHLAFWVVTRVTLSRSSRTSRRGTRPAPHRSHAQIAGARSTGSSELITHLCCWLGGRTF